MFERQAAGKRTATAGWYNTAAFEHAAANKSLYAKTVNGDAFSKGDKDQVIDLIKKESGKSRRRNLQSGGTKKNGEDGTVYQSVLKTTGEDFTNKNLNLKDNTIGEKTIEAATEEEVEATVKVMGGEDWKAWIRALTDADAIEEDAVTFAYSYIGPELTYPIYFEGTIGAAKKHLHKTAGEISEEFKENGISAYIST